VLALALSWLKNNLQTTLARQVSQASANRLRGLFAPQRDTLLVGFLRHTYRDTLDQLVDMDTKLVTATYRRVRIPMIPATQSSAKLPCNPEEACHPIQTQAATPSERSDAWIDRAPLWARRSSRWRAVCASIPLSE
jgi:hypothetical protein